MSTQDIYNAIKVNDQVTTSGQPTEAQLEDAAAEGFNTVINLALPTSRDALPDEAGSVTSLGMKYRNILVEWSDPKDRDFDAFEQAMQEYAADKKLIHCQANYRVSAFYSLYAQKHLDWSQTDAENFRAKIWKEGDDPTWFDFIDHITAKINAEK